MDIAVIKGGQVDNACLFGTLEEAQRFLEMGVWEGAQAVVELAEGFGIGDGYDVATGVWTRAVEPEPEEPAEPVEAGMSTDDYLLDLDYRVTMLEIMNGGELI